ncbi:endodeoxyribonuclease [Marasmius tenuissimus]|nr:endodeoxyribonuclease [Marasmius tenuissimus]
MATRQLVKTLSDCLPKRIPVVALVDGDPYGIDILSVYKYGSRALSHENSKLAASRLKWLGVWSTELSGLGVDKDALIPITTHDEKKALSLLRKKMPAKWRKELTHMLHNRRKAEIEVLASSCSLSIPSMPSNESALEASSTYFYTMPPLVSAITSPSESPVHVSGKRSPLVQYVVHKLSACVATSVSQI